MVEADRRSPADRPPIVCVATFSPWLITRMLTLATVKRLASLMVLTIDPKVDCAVSVPTERPMESKKKATLHRNAFA